MKRRMLVGFYNEQHGDREIARSMYVEIEYTAGRFSYCFTGPNWFGRSLECIDGLTGYGVGFDAATVETLIEIGQRYHLNDLQAGCEHQRAMGWQERRLDDNRETGWHVDKYANLAQWKLYAGPGSPGILCRPCPICGYKYGSEWKTEPVPLWALKWIMRLIQRVDNAIAEVESDKEITD